MKILFYPYHLGYLHTKQSLSSITGLPMSVPYTMKDMEKDLWGVTSNTGNTVHVEAPARMLEYDTFNSASTFLYELYSANGNDPVETARQISKKFDYLVISEANVFRLHGRNKIESEENSLRLRVNADILDNLTIPFSVIGAGIQTMPPDDLNEFDSNIAYFINIVNKKAELFGVRGRATRDWLKRAGIDRNVKALGCPSLFLYPNNILNLKYKQLNNKSKVLTAGYLNPRYIKHAKKRVSITNEIAKNFITDYVFQDDYYQLFEGEKLNFYNEAIGLVDRNKTLEKLNSLNYSAENINHFLHFRNSYSWRLKSSGYDVYIGDRLHGGIVSMQAMTPSLIFYDDYRVKELADLFKFPSCSIKEILHNGLMQSIYEHYTEIKISEFKENYLILFNNFRREIKNAGLKLRECY